MADRNKPVMSSAVAPGSTSGGSSSSSSHHHHHPLPPADDFPAPLAEAASLLLVGDPSSTMNAEHHHHHHVPSAPHLPLQPHHQHQQASAHHHDGNSSNSNNANTNNKWNKNGYGAVVQKQSGKFSRSESEDVRRAVEEYCHQKQIPISKLCSECDHKAEFKGAWMEIAKKLPHRSVQSVYRHGIRQLHPFKRGAWSDEECMLLADHVQKYGKKWSTIQSKLNRSADSCRDKYREMSEEFIKGRWKEHDTEMLKRVIREQLNVGPDMDMKDVGRMVEEQGIQISWSVVSKRMGNRSRLSCFKKWQKLSGVTGNLMGDVDLEAHSQPHHHDHHDSALLKRGRAAGDDEDVEDEDDDDDVDFSGLHQNHHHLHSLTGGMAPPPGKRPKGSEKIEFPQAATAGAAAAMAHQQHQHQLQPFAHHPPMHEGMASAATGLQQQHGHYHPQQQQPASSIHPNPIGTAASSASVSAVSASANSNPFRNVVQQSNEMLFDASQAEAIMEAVKLPDPGRLK